MFRYEMHLHTSACSGCSFATVEEMVRKAKECGYAGVVLTNHFFGGNTCVDRRLPWAEFVDAYRKDWLCGKALGDAIGVDVLFGIEEVYEPGKEVLIYGLTPEQIEAATEWRSWGIAEISDYVRKCGGFLACAHPFRTRDYIPEPDKVPDVTKFDGVEVYNQFNSPQENERAARLAQEHGMPGISGGDVHRLFEMGDAGLAFYERIPDGASLVKALKEGRYKRIVNGAIAD